ncbi:Coenzyme F420-reducing hydrogenase, alpha subunit [Malonomonas rubra DSM 5091]|uniref:Coenzyme F420-reducing hydrogenase, alpha subunit n=1 Tax=Malonomonas rubra DSM 5091 TaxID=1122189 RepID=A0A1M6GDI5_MALRU|nr:Ni/Fe hydrogenase subunit alpha [Malonomonas rubra]SHJ07940.1 Coenzyme F420-reducing hydrogenase, alpha subunit [Malonomonas rubra DSM 5091]
MKIELDYLTRIEGHGHLIVERDGDKIVNCRLQVVETPRFFEAMLQGRHISDVSTIVARVCGVCSISHTLVSLKTMEKALQIEVPPQAQLLRRLLSYGETAQSHLLHLYFMALPDHLGVPSLFKLLDSKQELVARALRLKRTANRICEVVGGRSIHPVTTCLGGFSARPEASELKKLRQELVATLPDLEATVELFASFEFPAFNRQRNALCLAPENDYPLSSDNLLSSNHERFPVTSHHQRIEEYISPDSTAKLARCEGDCYMVGPQARLRNGQQKLSPMAAKVATALSLEQTTLNPFENLKARLVEVIHCIEEALHCIDELLLRGMGRVVTPNIPSLAGEATAAIEAPRGTLFHSYRFNTQGIIEEANCIIPTAQNLASIEEDFKRLLPQLLDLSAADIQHKLEMLVRAYDPCLSCSTH